MKVGGTASITAIVPKLLQWFHCYLVGQWIGNKWTVYFRSNPLYFLHHNYSEDLDELGVKPKICWNSYWFAYCPDIVAILMMVLLSTVA
jgi:DNA-directed RNA polymerase subunit N (RpoN/RPB10)